MSDFLMFVLAKRCVQLEGDAGSGKTTIKDTTISLLPEDQVYTWSLSSETAPFYDNERINQCRYIDFPEFNKGAPKGVVSLATEIMKDLGERKDAARRVTDVIGANQGGAPVRELRIRYKPFHSTVATESDVLIGEEIKRRVVSITTKADREQTKRVLRHKGEKRMFPLREPEMTGLEAALLRGYVLKAIDADNGKNTFINPLGTLISESVPPRFTSARTMVDYLLDACEAVTKFYKPQRKAIGSAAYVTPGDCYEAMRVYRTVFLNGVLKLDASKKEILNVFNSDDEALRAADIQARLRANGYTPTKTGVATRLRSLVDAGYLDYSEESSKSAKYTLAADWHMAANGFDWGAACDAAAKFMRENYPDDAEQYIVHYCQDPAVVDPMTGERVRLRGVVAKVEEDKPKDTFNLMTSKPKPNSIEAFLSGVKK